MADLRTTEFHGERFALNDDVSQFALLEFAEAASEGQDGDTMQGLASLLRLVKECIAPADVVEGGKVVAFGVGKFLASARKHRATADELTSVIQAAFAEQAERPTGRPDDSSSGPVSIGQKSVAKPDGSISRFAGRPDLRVAVDQARAAATA